MFATKLASEDPLEEALEEIVKALQIPPGRYKEAERRYQSIGQWLNRPESILNELEPVVYIQGSFRLGTVIIPVTEDEHYDVDMVCELKLSKGETTQECVKHNVGKEIQGYADAHGMAPPDNGKRCWTLEYADSAQFHADILPAIPDGPSQQLFLERQGYSTDWSATAVAITDKRHPEFRSRTPNWPHSNPKGYSNWFRSRMTVRAQRKLANLAKECRAEVEDVPQYRVQTPLQGAIQMLKRHRDIDFRNKDGKPISIILTTLAAHAYQQEDTLSAALESILRDMDQYIEDRQDEVWIANPADPAENFAERWNEEPELEESFRTWLTKARSDFDFARRARTTEEAVQRLGKNLGDRVLHKAEASLRGRQVNATSPVLFRPTSLLGPALNPQHRQIPQWRQELSRTVSIKKCRVKSKGGIGQEYHSGGQAVPRFRILQFLAETDVEPPFDVYWQVVNTGKAARLDSGLRGQIEPGTSTGQRCMQEEMTRYPGLHSIECFIVKGGMLVARSGQFLVPIK